MEEHTLALWETWLGPLREIAGKKSKWAFVSHRGSSPRNALRWRRVCDVIHSARSCRRLDDDHQLEAAAGGSMVVSERRGVLSMTTAVTLPHILPCLFASFELF